MQRLVVLAAALAASTAFAATPAKPAKKAEPAPAPAVEETISPAQMEIAQRVHTGQAACEFNQNVHVQAMDGKPGFFKVAYGKANYTMTPQETTTGAVRLEDKRAGAVWIQIPAKSMLMDAKAGRRLVDSCMHAEQRTAGGEAQGGIGIVAAPAR